MGFSCTMKNAETYDSLHIYTLLIIKTKPTYKDELPLDICTVFL